MPVRPSLVPASAPASVDVPDRIPFQIAAAEPAPMLRAAPRSLVPARGTTERDVDALSDRIRSSLAPEAAPAAVPLPADAPVAASAPDQIAGPIPAPNLRRPEPRPATDLASIADAAKAPALDADTIVAAAPAEREPVRSAPKLIDAAPKTVLPDPARKATVARGARRFRAGPVRTGFGDGARVDGRRRAGALARQPLRRSPVKNWAVARTTRRGAFAGMKAPEYRRAAEAATSPVVSAQGFTAERQQQTNTFSGQALVRVRYQELAQLTR